MYLDRPKMKTKEVVKSNDLIQAGYTLSLVEQRLILLSIVQARETGLGIDAQTPLSVSASVYAHQFNVTLDAAYLALSSAADCLFERQVTFYDIEPLTKKPRRNKIRWVSKVAYVEGAGMVQLIFSPDIVPEITRLEANFTSYDLEQVSDLKSAYSIRLYELLIQWRSVQKTPLFLIDNLREKLGVEANEYIRMHHFKARVLDLAVEQINQHTDIFVSYEQHKSGRTITGFSFSFSAKKLAKLSQEKKTKSATSKVAPQKPIADLWDKLHEMELQACRKLNPSLTRSDVESLAQQQGVDALMIMHRIKTSTAKNFELTPVEP